MYILDTEYLVAAVDSGECDRVQEPVWEREPGRDCGGGDCNYGGEYNCRWDLLQNYGWKSNDLAALFLLVFHKIE